jgi:MgtC family
MPLPLHQFEYRLALALGLGAVLGIERQLHHKPAGTKTHALVAVGAALFVLLAEDMPGDASATGRVAAQIITGIGFLGAGTILRRDNTTITGLTTAATIWCAGAIGTLAGLGSWYQAAIGTAFILVANVLLEPLDVFINRRSPWGRNMSPLPSGPTPALTTGCRLVVTLAPGAESAKAVTSVHQLVWACHPQAVTVSVNASGPAIRISADLLVPTEELNILFAALQALPGIIEVQVLPLPTK